VITIDFESLPIEPRPDFPPKPVCVSIKKFGCKPVFAFGKEAMRAALAPIFAGKEELLFHNAAFDVCVAVEKLGLRMPKWQRIHDTKFLLFLHDPYKSLSLKPACKLLLGIGEEDQIELKEWIYRNVEEARGKKEWGKWIGYAPKRLLEQRAHGDTMRTEALFKKLMPEIHRLGMDAAYDRERRLLPMLLENSREGIRVNAKAIKGKLYNGDKTLIIQANVVFSQINEAGDIGP